MDFEQELSSFYRVELVEDIFFYSCYVYFQIVNV